MGGGDTAQVLRRHGDLGGPFGVRIEHGRAIVVVPAGNSYGRGEF